MPTKFTTVVSGGSICVEWADEQARYHIWINEDRTLNICTLFKNPLAGLKHGQPGYFDTRRLDPTKKANKEIIAQALAAADIAGALKAQAEVEAKEKADRDAQRKERERVERLNAAAPELLAAL